MVPHFQQNRAHGFSFKGRHMHPSRMKRVINILLESNVYLEMRLEERLYLINYLLKTYSRC